jgi:hypothetical protein
METIMTIKGKWTDGDLVGYQVRYKGRLIGYIHAQNGSARFNPTDHQGLFMYYEALINDRVFPSTPKEEDYLLYLIDMYEGVDSYAV